MYHEFLQITPWLFTAIVSVSVALILVVGSYITHKYWGNLFIRPLDNPVANIILRQTGTILSVLLAFAVISSWQDYELQRKNTAEEASTMGNLYRDCRGIDTGEEKTMQKLLVVYTRALVVDAWPKMKHRQESRIAWMAFNSLYGHIIRFTPSNAREEVVFGKLVQHLNDLAKFRRLRLLRNQNPFIPNVLWGTIYISTLLVVISGYFLRMESPGMQPILTAITGLVLGLIISMLLLMNHPYSSSLQISPSPIELLLNDVYPTADLTHREIQANDSVEKL